MKRFVLGVALCACALQMFAQGRVEDYQRAYNYDKRFSGKARNVYFNAQAVEGKPAFWYSLDGASGKEYVYLDAATRKTRPLFDVNDLCTQLSEKMGHEVTPQSLRLDDLRYNDETKQIRFRERGKVYIYRIDERKLENEKRNENHGRSRRPERQRHWMEVDNENEGEEVTSPDGKMVAYIRENNVWVRQADDSNARQLSFDGTNGFYYSTRISWSPDGKWVSSCKLRPALKHYVYYVESSPTTGVQPVLHKQEYAKPGDELNFKVPCAFEVETGRAIQASTELFPNPYSIQSIGWDEDSKALTFEYNERGHKVCRLLQLSMETGKVTTLIEETSDKYVNYPFLWRYDLKGGRYILWASERDNYRNLYMLDRQKPLVLKQITKRKWYVRDVIKVDEDNRQIWFSANGDVKGEDPYLIHYYRIGFDGKGLTELTPEMGTHKAWFTNDFQYMIDTYSTVENPPVTVLRDAKTGKVLETLARADVSELKQAGWRAPEVFCAPGRDGKTDMWGVIVRPTNFDKNKKYPVVEYIYAGPGSQYVPKSFQTSYWNYSYLAELGFIVVQVDGMGTSFRSREFENVCYKNLVDAGLPDHIAWLKAAAEKYPEIDTTRVGIYGASAGGQESTAAVLFHPEFYKAAYSACGCHDNRMDKIWWNELWMGYPVDSSYIRSSNVENAYRLTRPLMLVVGELDDNVDPASTMQVANALIKANKDFELVVLPGEHHTMGGVFGEHKRYDFFVKHLMGVEPPKWSEFNPKN